MITVTVEFGGNSFELVGTYTKRIPGRYALPEDSYPEEPSDFSITRADIVNDDGLAAVEITDLIGCVFIPNKPSDGKQISLHNKLVNLACEQLDQDCEADYGDGF